MSLTSYRAVPPAIAGNYNPDDYRFHNLRAAEIRADMEGFWEWLRSVNPKARMLLTVSPVPLAATATSNHILVATTYSKSVLRSVAGELAEDHPDIHYFPSYEIISSHPAHGMFYEPDLRNVNMFGVNYVMDHFFSGPLAKEFGNARAAAEEDIDLICEEGQLDPGV